MSCDPHGGAGATDPNGWPIVATACRLARRALPSLLISAVGPAACFIGGRQLWGLAGGVALALFWNGAAQLGRILRGQPCSGILLVGLIGLVTRGTLALALNSARMYFVAPAVVTAITGAAYVWSGFTRAPLVARMFTELVPPSVADPSSPRWRRALRRGTIVYGAEQIAVAILSLILVDRMAPTTYAAVHPVVSWAFFGLVAAAAVPFLRPDRRRSSDGLDRRPVGRALTAGGAAA